MAARQDQTQTIISSIFGTLFFVMCILAYLAYSSAKSEYARAEQLEEQKNQAENAARERIAEAEELRQMMGFDPGATMTDLRQRFEDDKKQYMSTFDEGSRAYRSVLDLIYAENEKIAQQEEAAKQQIKQLQESLVALEGEWKQQYSQAQGEADKAKQDLAGERERFRTERESIERQRQQLAQTLARKEQEFSQRAAEAEAGRDEAQEELVTTRRAIIDLQSKVEKSNPSFEVADGMVTYVNQQNGVAWINLGEADDLRRQVTFSVFASEYSDAAKAEKKGSLEVTRVLGDNLAEARITSDESSDPILPGDRIYSQVWEAGKPLRFGLTGLIDLDGDGASDLKRAKDLIELNGGIIDVVLGEDGQIDGQMTVNTDYLVLGESPDRPNQAAYREGFQTMSKQASDLGVDTITLSEFLNRVGYKPAEKTERFAGGGSQGGGSSAGRSFRFRTP
ncbi:hypothetical protein [Botrimarina sp.]|uniref:hypothetical protein n=1 Tax=Botrimarina sp. TaxID=2795802 RepID=UPI0032EF18D4